MAKRILEHEKADVKDMLELTLLSLETDIRSFLGKNTEGITQSSLSEGFQKYNNMILDIKKRYHVEFPELQEIYKKLYSQVNLPNNLSN